MTKWIDYTGILIVLMLVLAPNAAFSAKPPTVKIADAFLEMRTGPGRGYPIYHVAERGEEILILRQKTNWYLVRLTDGKEGWSKADELVRTITPDGEEISFQVIGKDDYEQRNWEIAVSYGQFDKTNTLSLTADWVFTTNLAMEFRAQQVVGRFSDSLLGSIGLQHQPYPSWLVSPFFGIGTGMIQTKPNSTIVQTEDRSDQYLYMGAGLRVYLTQRFFLRAEYNNYNILTSRDETEEIDEWKIGTAFFF